MPTPPRPAGLPDFADPPVAEVLLDAALDPLPLVRNAHLGVLWADHYREAYPTIEEQPPLPLMEEFSGPEQVFDIQFMGPPPVARQWFISVDGTRLLQVQPDRFIHNWRRLAPTAAEYPRYEALRESFERHFQTYVDFIREHELGAPTVRQAEVTYINQMQPDNVWKEPAQLHRVIRPWMPDFGDEGLLTDPLEDARLAWRHLITDGDRPYARLYVAVEPVPGGGLQIRLTVRGKPRDGTLEAAMAFFDMGRARIVNAFAAITTTEMHERWGRRYE